MVLSSSRSFQPVLEVSEERHLNHIYSKQSLEASEISEEYFRP